MLNYQRVVVNGWQKHDLVPYIWIRLVTSDWFAVVSFPISVLAQVPLDFGTVLVHTSRELKTGWMAFWLTVMVDLLPFFLFGEMENPTFLEVQQLIS